VIPSRKAIGIGRNRGDPDVAARVFEEPKHLLRGQAIFRRVEGARRRCPECVEAIGGRKTVETDTGPDPPLAPSGSADDLFADPAPIVAFMAAGWKP
jgi:hypothetical protein